MVSSRKYEEGAPCPRGSNLLTRVSELINPVTNQWDEELVRGTFHEDDAAVILAIPVQGNREDSIAWHFDKKGCFSVKSAYKFSVANTRDIHGLSSGGTVQCPTMGTAFPWKKIWQFHMPNKVKHFAWRLAHNNLPMKRKIQSRGMDINTRCPMCYRLDEDGGHLFFKCKYAKLVWRELMLEDKRVCLADAKSSKDVFRMI
jgi:hypothetical protein